MIKNGKLIFLTNVQYGTLIFEAIMFCCFCRMFFLNFVSFFDQKALKKLQMKTNFTQTDS